MEHSEWVLYEIWTFDMHITICDRVRFEQFRLGLVNKYTDACLTQGSQPIS